MTDQTHTTRRGAIDILTIAAIAERDPERRAAIEAAKARLCCGRPLCLCAACEASRIVVDALSDRDLDRVRRDVARRTLRDSRMARWGVAADDLRALRVSRGWTQEQAGAALRISGARVGQLERAEGDPTPYLLRLRSAHGR